jgi:hypothetical protein
MFLFIQFVPKKQVSGINNKPMKIQRNIGSHYLMNTILLEFLKIMYINLKEHFPLKIIRYIKMELYILETGHGEL